MFYFSWSGSCLLIFKNIRSELVCLNKIDKHTSCLGQHVYSNPGSYITDASLSEALPLFVLGISKWNYDKLKTLKFIITL